MIYPEAGAGANRRRGGGATNFMHGLKGGGGGIRKLCKRFASKNVKSCIWMLSTNTAY